MDYAETPEEKPAWINVPVKCCNCDFPLAAPMRSSSENVKCPICLQTNSIKLFQAALRPPEQGQNGETLTLDDDSSCFYHPSKKAVIACEHCGRFLCALCDIEMHGKRLCPTCVESGVTEGKLTELRSEVMFHDDIALSMAIFPMVFIWPTIISSIVTMAYVLFHSRKSFQTPYPRRKWRYFLAFLIAALQASGWAYFGISLLTKVFA
jgi:hypothetical protein